MDKLLTAEEFIKDRYDWSSEDLERWSESMSKLPMVDYGNVLDLMVEFAKMHAEAALKEASETKIKGEYNSDYYTRFDEDKDSILNSYPLKNIK